VKTQRDHTAWQTSNKPSWMKPSAQSLVKSSRGYFTSKGGRNPRMGHNYGIINNNEPHYKIGLHISISGIVIMQLTLLTIRLSNPTSVR